MPEKMRPKNLKGLAASILFWSRAYTVRTLMLRWSSDASHLIKAVQQDVVNSSTAHFKGLSRHCGRQFSRLPIGACSLP